MTAGLSRSCWIERSWNSPRRRSSETMRCAFSSASAPLPPRLLRTSEYARYTTTTRAASRIQRARFT
jgi:hypothetical protein